MAQFAPHYIPKFFQQPNDTYYCQQCCKILRPPVRQSYCGHRFCSLCVTDMFDAPNVVNCPANEYDCVNLRQEEFYPDVAISKELMRMVVFCRFHGEGCRVKKEWGNIANHENTCLQNTPGFAVPPCKIGQSFRGLESNVKDNRRNVQTLEKRIEEKHLWDLKIENRMDNLTSTVNSQQETIAELKTTIQMLTRQLMSPLIKCNDCTTNGNNVQTWHITKYTHWKHLALQDTSPFIEGKPFHIGNHGYKLSVRLYPNGCGDGKGSHVSLFFVLRNGECDNSAHWPFAKAVSFTMSNQRDGHKSLTATYNCNPVNQCWRKPTTGNKFVSAGITQFASHKTIKNGGFLRDDILVLITRVEDIPYRSWFRRTAEQ